MKIIVTIISTNLVANLLFSFFCSRLQTKNKNQVFGKLVVWHREIFLFTESVALYFKDMPNSIDFYKGMFLHVIPVHITLIEGVVPSYSSMHSDQVWWLYAK